MYYKGEGYMSVLTCSRRDCNNVMCNIYSKTYGYICDECFDELVHALCDIDTFMNSTKDKEKLDIRYLQMDDEFNIKE